MTTVTRLTTTRPGRDDDELHDEDDKEEEKEDWLTWLKRTTGMAEEALAKARIEDWPKQQRRNYWRWAGHVTRMRDNRWTICSDPSDRSMDEAMKGKAVIYSKMNIEERRRNSRSCRVGIFIIKEMRLC